MKIVVIVRTRDEEHRIAPFCSSYNNADMIIVGDGGSVDHTKDIANRFHNVLVLDYPHRVELANGHWRNNDSHHTNWLIKKAKENNADWIIFDDCDCRPNYLLRENFRTILEYTRKDYVMAVRLYLWGYDQHFPHLSKILGNHTIWEPSLWAWRGTEDFWTIDVPPAFDFRIGDTKVTDLHVDAKVLDLLPPYCLLHYSWDDEERVKQKVKIYRESGLIPNMNHPLNFGGPLEDVPDFAYE